MTSRRSFIAKLIAPAIVAAASKLTPSKRFGYEIELLDLGAMIQGFHETRDRRETLTDEITILTDRETWDKFKKGYARQMSYYRRHQVRHQAWRERQAA